MLLGIRQHQRMRARPVERSRRPPVYLIGSVPMGVRFRCAAFAIDPAGVAASVMFLLPDRDAMLHFIDDEPAGVEGFAAVGGADAHPYRHVGQVKGSDPMDAHGMLDGKALHRLRQDPVALLDGQRLKGFVLEARNFLTFVVIPDPALEADVASGTAVEQFAAGCCGVDRRFGEAKSHHPPATGGMNTTVSPEISLRDQSENSVFTATFNCARDGVKPYRALSSSNSSAGVAAEVSSVSPERPACSRIKAKYWMCSCMGLAPT